MGGCGKYDTWARAVAAVVGLCLGVGLVGCGQKSNTETTPEPVVPTAQQDGSSGKPATVANDGSAQAEPKPQLDPRLHQSFADATLAELPEGWERPPDMTLSGQSVGKLYTEVERLWNTIKFTSPAGKPLEYRAVIETDMGAVHLTLWSDVAPNHARNFIVLAKVGYFDGLVFDRTILSKPQADSDAKLELIEAGCPLGTGDMGIGSIGYWLKPEITDKVTHEEGTVSACLGPDAYATSCKFQISLCKAPYMDEQYTAFGKVTQGLDVARKILTLPVKTGPESPEGDRPEKPVVIRRVTIQVSEAESLAAK